MREYGLILAGLSALSCISIPCNAAIISDVRTGAFAETSGFVDIVTEASPEPWSDIDDPLPGTGDVSVFAMDTAEKMNADGDPVAEGTGTASSDVMINNTLANMVEFSLTGKSSVLFTQFEPEGVGEGTSEATSLVEFMLNTQSTITNATLDQLSLEGTAEFDVSLEFVDGDYFVPLDIGTPLEVGIYRLVGEASAGAFLDEDDVDKTSEAEYELDLTIAASNGGIVVPEPSSIFAWAIVALVCGTKLFVPIRIRSLSSV